MGAPILAEDRLPAAELGPQWVKLEEHAQAGAFAQVRAVAASISKGLQANDPNHQRLQERLVATIEYGRTRAFEVGMEAVGRSFMGLYDAASKMQGDGGAPSSTGKSRRRRR